MLLPRPKSTSEVLALDGLVGGHRVIPVFGHGTRKAPSHLTLPRFFPRVETDGLG